MDLCRNLTQCAVQVIVLSKVAHRRKQLLHQRTQAYLVKSIRYRTYGIQIRHYFRDVHNTPFSVGLDNVEHTQVTRRLAMFTDKCIYCIGFRCTFDLFALRSVFNGDSSSSIC